MTDRTTHRPRLAIGLRSLLLLVLVAACWMAWRADKARRQGRAVAAILAYGGSIQCDDLGSDRWAPAWLRSTLDAEYFREVIEVSFAYSGPPRGSTSYLHALEGLQDLPGLERLTLNGEQATDEGMACIRGLGGLETLRFAGAPRLSDVGLDHLGTLKGLRSLDVNGYCATDGWLEHIGGLSRLEILSIGDAGVSGRGLAHLGRLPNLRVLRLSGGSRARPGDWNWLTEGDLVHLAELSKLEHLTIESPYLWMGGDPERLKHLSRLRTIYER
jgi:hypothetical protein